MKPTIIAVDPKEVVERVDDMLAWLAIASEGRYAAAEADSPFGESGRCPWLQSAYMRAIPSIHLGGWDVGELGPGHVVCDEEDEAEPWDETDARATLQGILRDPFHLGERPCVSMISQSTGLTNFCDSTFVVAGDKPVGQSVFHHRDTTYRLAGFAKVAASDRLPFHWPGLNAVRRQRLYVFQSVTAFKDGTSAFELIPLVADGDRLLVPHQKGLGYMRGGLQESVEAAITYMVWRQKQRLSEWTVELALSGDRSGVGLQTDAGGALAFAAALRRSVGSAESRVVLAHWVSEHMRRRRKSGADPSLVRAHLRGRQVLRAGHYHVRIYPSRVDINRACNGVRFDQVSP